MAETSNSVSNNLKAPSSSPRTILTKLPEASTSLDAAPGSGLVSSSSAIAPPSTMASLSLTSSLGSGIVPVPSLQEAINAITGLEEIQAFGGKGVEAGTLVGKLILPEFDSDNPKDIAQATYMPADLALLFGVETTASASTSAAPKPTQAAYVE
ncbi:MAG: hypothetical protein WC860_07595, partial [Candidatus Margulisiibacteriota bacterium]